jgi:hypothetical protein
MCMGYNLTLCYPSKTMILLSTERKETDLVYNFYKIDTVDDESENKTTALFFKCAPIASNAIYTTFNSLKVI